MKPAVKMRPQTTVPPTVASSKKSKLAAKPNNQESWAASTGAGRAKIESIPREQFLNLATDIRYPDHAPCVQITSPLGMMCNGLQQVSGSDATSKYLNLTTGSHKIGAVSSYYQNQITFQNEELTHKNQTTWDKRVNSLQTSLH